ncbi:hypothetical protein HpCS30_03470 [Helicobacter pylori]
MVSGHTIIFGGTGAGKTTLIEFLITNCFKYEDLSILALDRNNGMRVMTEFLDGQYNDSNDFYINPFSLSRKLNGVLTLAFQDINQLDGVKGAKSIIENAAQVILYPTNNFEKLESYGILLSPIEKSFLNKTPLNARQVLVKNLLTQSSVFLEINLEKLNSTSKKFLRAYSSSASSVFELETLKKDNPKNYKEIYLTKE